MTSTVASTFVAADGEGYERQMGRWSRRLAPLFIAFAGIKHAQRVLDVGCGTGSLSFCLAQYQTVASIHGIDLAPEYIAHAASRNRDPRLAFDIGDARALPFADRTFDHALSMLTLQFVPQAALAVREMRRVTRPGGTVAAMTWDARGGFVAQRIVLDTAAMLDPKGNDRRARAFTRPLSRPGELAAVWREAGLQDVVQDMLTIRMDFASFADFWAPNEGKDGPLADYVRTLDDAMRHKLRDAVTRAYLDGESDGPRSYAATAWVVKGTVPE